MSTQPATQQNEGAAQTQKKLISPLALIIDAVIVVLFFAFMFTLIKPHVQSDNPWFIALWGGGAAACMSAVFWLAIQMFRVVLRAQLNAKHRN